MSGIYVWCVHSEQYGLCLVLLWFTDGMPFNQPGSPLVPGTPAVSSEGKLWPLAAGFSITDDVFPSRLYQEDSRQVRPRSASSTMRRNPRCWGCCPLQEWRSQNENPPGQSQAACAIRWESATDTSMTHTAGAEARLRCSEWAEGGCWSSGGPGPYHVFQR